MPGRWRRFSLAAAARADEEPLSAVFQAGTEVEVICDDVRLYHVPKLHGTPFNPRGLRGTVVQVIEGEDLTPNRPILVKLLKTTPPGTIDKPQRFNGHFAPEELRLCGGGPEEGAAAEAAAVADTPPAAPEEAD